MTNLLCTRKKNNSDSNIDLGTTQKFINPGNGVKPYQCTSTALTIHFVFCTEDQFIYQDKIQGFFVLNWFIYSLD